MKKKLFNLFVVMFVASLVAACNSSPGSIDNNAQTTLPALIIAEGRLFPAKTLDQVFTITGQVAEVYISNGDEVISGQVLASLHVSAEANALLARAQEEALLAQQSLADLKKSADLSLTQGRLAVALAQKELDDAEIMFKAERSVENRARRDAANAQLLVLQATQERLETNEGIDPERLAAAEARLASANAAWANAQAYIEAHKLIASMSGSVTDLNLTPGQWITGGQSVVVLADIDQWVVKTENVTEVEVVNLSIGQSVDVVFDSMPEKSFEGKVVQINSRFEEKRGDITYTVAIDLEQNDPTLRWGMTAAVYFRAP